MKRLHGIAGLSEARRLPRLGKIRLGIKLKSAKGTEYPAELPFFLLPPEASALGGQVSVARAQALGVTRKEILDFVDKNASVLAEELPIMFPVDDEQMIFPQALKWYGAGAGLKCTGTGTIATRINEKTGFFEERECPCEMLKSNERPQGECVPRAHLMFFLPSINLGGVWQLDMGSRNSIIDINSGIDLVRGLIGRLALVPLKLRRIPITTNHGGKKQRHYTLQLLHDVPAHELQAMRQDTSRVLFAASQTALSLPVDVSPAHDMEGTIVVDEDSDYVPEETESPAPPPVPLAPPVATKPIIKPDDKIQAFKARLNAAKSVADLDAIFEEINEAKLAGSQVVELRRVRDARSQALRKASGKQAEI